MKSFVRIGLLTLAALFVAVAFVSCGKNAKVLVMGTNAAFPPFESKGGASGTEVVGLDVEIAKEIAKDLGRELKVEDIDFDGLLPALGSGKIDLAIAGMTITDERKQNVNFSDPYYAATQSLLVRSENVAAYTSLDVLKGKKIAVQLGTTGDGAAKKLTAEGNVVQFQTMFEALMELNNKKVDAAIIDEQPAKVLLTKYPELANTTVTFPAEYYGIAAKKGNDELTAAVNKTLARLKADGSYDKLVAEWIK